MKIIIILMNFKRLLHVYMKQKINQKNYLIKNGQHINYLKIKCFHFLMVWSMLIWKNKFNNDIIYLFMQLKVLYNNTIGYCIPNDAINILIKRHCGIKIHGYWLIN